ncbi:MAG: translation elongation factor Ts [Candidatus Amoebophilus sp. 36-38]|nr:MAG: translation elongation factor Ts [Candidatus Amoebophilus sp. 36-38]
MGITAQDINKLRQLTGAGMMDCKKALTEAQGDIDKAIELLRKKGQKIAAARAGMDTTEGLALAEVNKTSDYGAIIALSCETDFVAKNETFRKIAQHILATALSQCPTDLEALRQLDINGLTVQEYITEIVGKMGENITLTAYETLDSEVVVSYIHTGNKLAVLVGLEGARGEQVITAGKDVAMQIAALNPIAVDKDDVAPAVVEQELSIAREQSSREAKNPAMLENIAQGRLNKFFKEYTLVNQPFVKDNSLTVAQYLAKVAPGLKVKAFKRVLVGA